MQRLPSVPEPAKVDPIVRAILEAKRPVLYVGGGCLNAAEEVKELVALTGIPVA